MAICKPCSESRHQLCAGENCECVATHVAEAAAAFEKARFATGSHQAGSILIVCQGGLVREVIGAEKRYEICDMDSFEDASEQDQLEYYDGLSKEMQDYLPSVYFLEIGPSGSPPVLTVRSWDAIVSRVRALPRGQL